jgi:DNA polymerase-3 subunit delta'
MLKTALDLSQGSVRRALELATGEGIGLYRDVLDHLGRLPELDGPVVQRLADRISGVSETERLELFFSLLLGVVERLIRATATGQGAIGQERELARRLLARDSLPQWVDVWEAIGAAKDDALSLNLDRNLLVLETFHRLQQVARRHPV